MPLARFRKSLSKKDRKYPLARRFCHSLAVLRKHPKLLQPRKRLPPKHLRKKQLHRSKKRTKAEESAEEDFEYSGEFPPPASPSLRRLSQDLGIDLRKIRGSEGGGRIVLSDLKAYIQNLQRAAKAKTPSAPGQAAPKPVAPQIDFSRFGSIYKRPMTELRKIIAQRMTENSVTIPHVTQFDDIDLTNIMELRKKYAEAYEKKGAKLTVTSFAVKALVNALKKHPIFNTSLDELANEIIFKEYFHVGIAVDSDQGLMVPVLRDADKKDLMQISKDLSELATKTRDRKVSMEEMQGGSITISNQGAFRWRAFHADRQQARSRHSRHGQRRVQTRCDQGQENRGTLDFAGYVVLRPSRHRWRQRGAIRGGFGRSISGLQ